MKYNKVRAAFFWWLNKVENYLTHKYSLGNTEFADLNKEIKSEALYYIELFPKFSDIVFSKDIKDLRNAFDNKKEFDKVVNLK